MSNPGGSNAGQVRRLQGIVTNIERTEEVRIDEEGNAWRKCIFTVELVGFSKRTPSEGLPRELKGAKVKVPRWCCFDWHYKTGVKITLTPEESEAILKGESIPAEMKD